MRHTPEETWKVLLRKKTLKGLENLGAGDAFPNNIDDLFFQLVVETRKGGMWMAAGKLESPFQTTLEHSSPSPLLVHPIGVSVNPTSSSCKCWQPSSWADSIIKSYVYQLPLTRRGGRGRAGRGRAPGGVLGPTHTAWQHCGEHV